ncbi:transporter substrate-binding domain-containing protein [Hydrogenophaga sp. 5NK40-0174]|uniref:substrate-binding periplasmic protein n=1 Tax=Hydrogenophaga sp. 5NK40-0174 TaxID=3127649 RepID=UPI003102A90D
MILSTLRGAMGALSRRKAVEFSALLFLGMGLTGLAQAEEELMDLDKVKASGVLKVAVYKDFAPFSDGKDGNVKGLDVSIGKALADKLGLRMQLLPFYADENMHDDLRNMVWKGHYLGFGPADVMMHVPVDRYLVDENPQTMIFGAYMREQPVVLHDLRKIEKVTHPEDLKGFKLTAERGAGTASMLLGHGGGMLREQVSILNTGVDAAQAVVDGKAAASFITRAQAEAVLANVKEGRENFALSQVTMGGMPTRGWPIGMAIKSKNKELGLALDAALRELQASGELLAIFKEHHLTLTAP